MTVQTFKRAKSGRDEERDNRPIGVDRRRRYGAGCRGKKGESAGRKACNTSLAPTRPENGGRRAVQSRATKPDVGEDGRIGSRI